ncbi:hypothetical protein Tco_1171064 [Tanacetum coccineum]
MILNTAIQVLSALSTWQNRGPRWLDLMMVAKPDDDDDDDDNESTIPLNEIISQIPKSITITHVVPTMEPEDSLNMEDEHLSIIPKKEPDEFIKSSVEDLVPKPESLPEEDVQEENFKIYSNLLFEFDDGYISSDVNPLFNEVLENIENKDFYVSNFDEPDLLVTSLSDAKMEECFFINQERY